MNFQITSQKVIKVQFGFHTPLRTKKTRTLSHGWHVYSLEYYSSKYGRCINPFVVPHLASIVSTAAKIDKFGNC